MPTASCSRTTEKVEDKTEEFKRLLVKISISNSVALNDSARANQPVSPRRYKINVFPATTRQWVKLYEDCKLWKAIKSIAKFQNASFKNQIISSEAFSFVKMFLK